MMTQLYTSQIKNCHTFFWSYYSFHFVCQMDLKSNISFVYIFHVRRVLARYDYTKAATPNAHLILYIFNYLCLKGYSIKKPNAHCVCCR